MHRATFTFNFTFTLSPPHYITQHETNQAKTTSYKVVNVTRTAVAASISTSVLAWETLDLRQAFFFLPLLNCSSLIGYCITIYRHKIYGLFYLYYQLSLLITSSILLLLLSDVIQLFIIFLLIRLIHK